MKTEGISAEEYEDYEPKDGESIYLLPDEAINVSISIHDDTEIEPDEYFRVRINRSDTGGGVREVEVTILDDDCKPCHLLSINYAII